MEAIKLGKNGQIAIPRAVMKRLNLKGDETLLLEVGDDGVIRLRRPRATKSTPSNEFASSNRKPPWMLPLEHA